MERKLDKGSRFEGPPARTAVLEHSPLRNESDFVEKTDRFSNTPCE